jgi:hypothetical protein
MNGGKHGIYIKQGWYQVILPQVTEYGWIRRLLAYLPEGRASVKSLEGERVGDLYLLCRYLLRANRRVDFQSKILTSESRLLNSGKRRPLKKRGKFWVNSDSVERISLNLTFLNLRRL